ncbi:D-alanine--D-alanine ligase [soil metagenome]
MKPTIALLTGGYSGEAVISYESAKVIEKNIDPDKFSFYKINMTPECWFYENENEKYKIDKNDFSLSIDGNHITFDAVLIGIHGTPGEDGKLQGYFDILNLPYTSCDCTTSALTFNKRYTNAVAAFSGLSVARSVILFKKNFSGPEEITRHLNFPVFIKPNNGGSSIGMSKVNNPSEELGLAIEKAFKEDDQVLVEEFIKGREFTLGVFKSEGKIIALPITEIITRKDFFDYEAKYHGASEEITPAKVDEPIAEIIREEAKKAYKIFNCKGIIRVDYIYSEEKQKPFMLEINTVPGQSEASLVPQQVRAMGWTMMDFYTALLDECLRS